MLIHEGRERRTHNFGGGRKERRGFCYVLVNGGGEGGGVY